MHRSLVMAFAAALVMAASASFVSAAVPIDTSPNISAAASPAAISAYSFNLITEATLPSVDSTSDARTVNNAVRHQYRVLTEGEKAAMQEVKDLGLAFIERIDKLGPSREVSIAKTNAEQAVMWAVKHITS